MLGNAAAYHEGYFSWPVFLLALLTATLFQVISNFANDYGDYVHGADSDAREGPRRAVESGTLSKQEMKRGIIICSLLSVISTVLLLYLSFPAVGWTGVGILFLLGLLSIIAAITYTASSNPYGYRGWGDPAVFIFFGLLAVMGAFYLHTGFLNAFIVFPALVMGFLSTAVLNVNNTRDLESDKKAGKQSIAVMLGERGARLYHGLLILAGFVALLGFLFYYFSMVEMLIGVLFYIPALYNFIAVLRTPGGSAMGPYLKQMVLSSLIAVIALSLILVI